MSKHKIIRACTVSNSLEFVTGILSTLLEKYDIALVASPGSYWCQVDAYRDKVKCIEVPMERHISPLKDIKSLWRLWRVFRSEKPTMVHSMTPKAGMLCMVAAWLARVPVRVHTFTGLVFPTAKGIKKRILMFTDGITCACATHVIPEGKGVLNDLKNNGITRKPMRVLGHGNVQGIDLVRFDRTPEVTDLASRFRVKDKFTFVSIGRLVGDKGINELVEAFVRLNRECPDTRLLLVGERESELDPLKPETENQINNCQAICAVGRQKDVRPWLAASDCAVLASYREGFPNVVIEAGAMGLPQIVTDINGANEIIINGQNGLIIPPHDADSLYEAMKRMVTDSELRIRLSADARRLIAERYEQGYVRQCLLDFYDEILKEIN